MNAFAALAPLREALTEDAERLAEDLLDHIDDFRIDAVTTPEIAAEAETWLRTRIQALHAVRDDEKAWPEADRDTVWLGASKQALKEANALLFQVSQRAAEFRRIATAEARQAREARRAQAFIDAAKARLDRTLFLALWAEVDRATGEGVA